MAEFEVNVVKIDDVQEHPNADRLTIVTIGGYQCISNKLEDGSWRYNKGDLVVYIPEQSVLPEWLLQKMGFWNDKDYKTGKGTLSGSRGNRVKACKLRGVVSQGLIYPAEFLSGDTNKEGNYAVVRATEKSEPEIQIVKTGDNVAEFLNIVKYEPSIPVQMRGVVGNLHGYTKSYDIENLQKYNKVLEDGEDVIITEKLHGTYCQIGLIADFDDETKEKALENKDISHIHENAYGYVTSKGLAGKGLVQKNVDSNTDNLYMRVFNNLLQSGQLKQIADFYSSYTKTYRVYLMGEIFGKGVQDLHYGLQKEPEFRLFDVYLEDRELGISHYENVISLKQFSKEFDIPMVPILYEGPYSLEVADKHRVGDDTISGQHIREGIVIRSSTNRQDVKLGRVQLKYISPDYLLRKGGTENN